jgi:ParB family chromosome partitioning protein
MSESVSVFQLVLIDHIHSSPHQARKTFDSQSLRALADSLQQEGLIQPVTVRVVDTGYELISGERRLRAAKLLGWKSIEAKVIHVISEGEAAAKGLIENLQREDLNPVEEAEGFAELNRVDSSYWTQEKVAQITGKSRSYVTQSLHLLALPESIQNDVRHRRYSRAHALELNRLSDTAAQLSLAEEIKLEGLSREKTRRRVDELRKAPALGAPLADVSKKSREDPLAGVWPEFLLNPWLRSERPIKVKYLGELRWSFDLPGPKWPSASSAEPESQNRLRKALGDLLIRMGRSISYGDSSPAINPLFLGDRQVPRAPNGKPPQEAPKPAAKASFSPSEELDHSELARLPHSDADMAEALAAAAQGVAAFYRWVYGDASAVARESEDLSWENLGTNAQEGPLKILDRLREMKSRTALMLPKDFSGRQAQKGSHGA